MDQFAFSNAVRSSGGIANLCGRVHAELVKDGGGQITWSDRIAVRIGPQRVASAVDVTTLDPAPRQDGSVAIRPVIATGVLVDSRSSPELADLC